MKLIIFDCDSTLTSLEGIDELARLKGEKIFKEIEDLTNDAMDGRVPINEIFGRRLSIIQPDCAACEQVSKLILETVEPTAKDTMATLKAKGWTPIILSGGLTQVIKPLAKYLGIDEIQAVDLIFDAQGAYFSFDTSAPPTRNGGKPEIVAQLRKKYHPERIIMVGDGISDLETKPEVDQFIGFTRYGTRSKVTQEADLCISALAELADILD